MDSDGTASADRLVALVADGDTGEAAAYLDRFHDAPAERRKDAVRALREVTDESPAAFEGLLDAVVSFLTDDERAVRLSTAKLVVAVAAARPDAVRPVVDPLADRLADDDEFYYVRARCAEALGYVALEYPEAVASPETLADLRVGLEFDEPEVKEKLAKALEYVAAGDPDRLRHGVERLAEHVDDDEALVRYHLLTALVAVGCAHPERLAEVTDRLAARLDDPEPYVRGRAAQALGLVAGSGADVEVPTDDLTGLAEDDEPFVAERARFARRRLGRSGGEDGDGSEDDGESGGGDGESGDGTIPSTAVGTLDAVRESTDAAVEDMTAPDADGECPHCGLELPEEGPPMCPRCGAPR